MTAEMATKVPERAQVLSIKGLTAAYDGVRVLHGVDITVLEGETVAVLGRNGAGKSTLAASIFNLDAEVGGDVVLRGQRVSGWPTFRIAWLGAALVPQGRGVFPSLSVDDNLRMAALHTQSLRNPRWVKERIYSDFPRLAERRAFVTGALSGGERQMLAIARALLTQSTLIVFDEPSEGLAPMAIEDVVVATVEKLRNEGYTMLIAEQNIAMALKVSTRALLLDHGRIVYDGPAVDLASDKHLQREHLGL